MVSVFLSFFVFKQKSAYEMRISDWSSDVCSSDLAGHRGRAGARAPGGVGAAARRAMAWHLRRPRRVWSRDAGLGDLPRARDPSARAAGGAGDRDDLGPLSQRPDRPRLPRSEGPTSELQSLMRISYAVFCLKKKK